MTAAICMVLFTFFICIFNAHKLRKHIERRIESDFLKNAQKDVSMFEEYSEAEKQKTSQKLKKLKELKGRYND